MSDLDNCTEAALIRAGARDRQNQRGVDAGFQAKGVLEQAAYLQGFNLGDNYETALCPCLNMTKDQCSGECNRQDSVGQQRQFFENH